MRALSVGYVTAPELSVARAPNHHFRHADRLPVVVERGLGYVFAHGSGKEHVVVREVGLDVRPPVLDDHALELGSVRRADLLGEERGLLCVGVAAGEEGSAADEANSQRGCGSQGYPSGAWLAVTVLGRVKADPVDTVARMLTGLSGAPASMPLGRTPTARSRPVYPLAETSAALIRARVLAGRPPAPQVRPAAVRALPRTSHPGRRTLVRYRGRRINDEHLGEHSGLSLRRGQPSAEVVYRSAIDSNSPDEPHVRHRAVRDRINAGERVFEALFSLRLNDRHQVVASEEPIRSDDTRNGSQGRQDSQNVNFVVIPVR